LPDWVESAITEAISEFKQLPADAIRDNFAEIYAQDDDSTLTAFLKMQTGIETADEVMQPYMQKLVRPPCTFPTSLSVCSRLRC
jgi:hypothetical protein